MLRGAVGASVSMSKSLGVDPGLKRFLVAPSRYHQPLPPRVGRSKQLEALGTFLVVDRAGSLGKPALKLVPGTATVMASILMIVMFRSDQTRPRQSGREPSPGSDQSAGIGTPRTFSQLISPRSADPPRVGTHFDKVSRVRPIQARARLLLPRLGHGQSATRCCWHDKGLHPRDRSSVAAQFSQVDGNV